jgi:phenylalanyl-tRNA synthetase beta chain
VRLFEAGAVYLPQPGQQLPNEPYHVGALLIGSARVPTWRDPSPPLADFYAAKGVLGGLLGTLRVPHELRPAQEPFLHPGRRAAIVVEGKTVGWLGEVHPLVGETWELTDTVAGFELDLDAAGEHAVETPLYEDVTSFPRVHEDLAVIVDDSVAAARVVDVVRRAGAPLLEHADVFDVYRDVDKLGAGKVSLALRLTFRARDRTLTDAEVAGKRREITEALSGELGGRVRAG